MSSLMNDIIYAGKHSLTRNVSRHAHSSWELIYCTGGDGELVFDDGTELSYEPKQPGLYQHPSEHTGLHTDR